MPRYNCILLIRYSHDLEARERARDEALRREMNSDVEAEELTIDSLRSRIAIDISRIKARALHEAMRATGKTFIDWEILENIKHYAQLYAPREWKLRALLIKDLEASDFQEALKAASVICNPRGGEVVRVWAYASYGDIME